MITRFCRNNTGSIGVLGALLIVPLCLAVGIAVDFTRGDNARNDLQRAADAAVLAGVRFIQSGASTGEVKERVKTMLDANYVDAQGVLEQSSITIEGMTVSAKVSASVPVTLMRIMGTSKIDVAVASSATVNIARTGKLHIFMYLDRSASTNIPSTKEGRQKLIDLTRPMTNGPIGCAFGCHWQENQKPEYSHVNFYDVARMNGIRLREDDILDLLTDFTTEMYSSLGDDMMMTIYGFSDEIQRLVDSHSGQLDVATIFDGSTLLSWGTRLDLHMPRIPEQVLNGLGEGKEPVVVLITDGWNDNYGFGDDAPLDNAWCNEIKRAGIRLAVVNMTYPDLPDQEYMTKVQSNYGLLQYTMKNCASPGLYFKGDEGPELAATIADMAKKLSTPSVPGMPRLLR